jgi:hypothetical protein
VNARLIACPIKVGSDALMAVDSLNWGGAVSSGRVVGAAGCFLMVPFYSSEMSVR